MDLTTLWVSLTMIQTYVFWFGRVTPSENALDVRVGYNDEHLFLHVAVLSLICSRKHVVEWGAFWGGTFVGTSSPIDSGAMPRNPR